MPTINCPSNLGALLLEIAKNEPRYTFQESPVVDEGFYFSIQAPPGTPYAGGIFEYHIQFHQPKGGYLSEIAVRLLTPIWNTYIDSTGQILRTWDGFTHHSGHCGLGATREVIDYLEFLFQRPPSREYHYRKNRHKPGWNEHLLTQHLENPEQYNKKAESWTTCYAKGIWNPSIHSDLTESFRNDIKLFLLIHNRVRGGDQGRPLPRDLVLLIIHYLIPRRVG